METIGGYIRRARNAKRYSLEELSERTKIKVAFLKAIEKADWETLPALPVVTGFVKSVAGALSEDTQKMLSLLRRDYPPKKLEVNPKPDIKTRFGWTPKLTFITGVTLVILVIAGYLGIQYLNFLRPPKLKVVQPVEGQVINEARLEVRGETDGEAVRANNQPILVEENGEFAAEIEVNGETAEVVVTAKSRSGKETTITRRIKVEIFE